MSATDPKELARKAALFQQGAFKLYDEKGDMWFFELYHFLSDVKTALWEKDGTS